jgi:hypothetical protein
MRVVALRGVCIGPGKHLAPGEDAEVDPATASFLKSIAAVEDFKEPPQPAPESESVSAPAKSGKKEK